MAKLVKAHRLEARVDASRLHEIVLMALAPGPAILEECKAIVRDSGRLPAGQAVITTGGYLPARHVIHTVGPVWSGGGRGEEETLASAYRESLTLAIKQGLKTVSFPSISTGAYRYPVDQAARVALGEVIYTIEGGTGLEEVRFVLFDNRTFQAYTSVLDELAKEKGLKTRKQTSSAD